MAIKVNGTTVINDSRALSNIASVDATTVAALGAAGVGGGDVQTVVVTWNTHAAFTKPADGLNNIGSIDSDGTSTTPPSNKRIMQTPALTNGVTAEIQFFFPTPSVYSRRGSYWGSQIVCAHYDSSAGLWKRLANFGAWTSDITWPYTTELLPLASYGSGDYFEIYATDVYDGQGGTNTAQYNDNLSFNANTLSIKLTKLAV